MSPPPTLPLFPTLELRFSDDPESVEPEVPIEAPALALSTQFIFGPTPPPATTTTTKTPPKTTKRQRAAALRRKKAAAALREKKADAAARERDPNYHPLNLKKDYHLILNPPRIDPKIPATPKPSDDREPPSGVERKRSREKSRSAPKRPSSDIAEDSGSSERPLKSDDESYTPSGKGSNKKKKSCTERQERRLQPGEDSSGGTNTSSRGTDDEPQLIRGLLSDSPLSSHPLSTDRFISLSKPRGSVKERPCRRGNVQSMYTPLKEFLYKRHGDDSPRRKGYSREEQHVEEEEKKISALRSQLESRMRALEAYVATASKAAGDFQTYDTICTEDAESKKKEPVKGRSKDGGAVRPVNKRKRRRRIGR